MAIQDTKGSSNETQKQLIAKLVNSQAHAGYQVWIKSGIATARIEQQSKDIIAAIKGVSTSLIKEDDKDDAEDDTAAELERKRKKEQEEEDRRKGIFGGIGSLMKTIAMGKDGKGEKGLFKGGLLGFGKMGIGGIAATLNFLFKALKFIGGPFLLIGCLAFLALDD